VENFVHNSGCFLGRIVFTILSKVAERKTNNVPKMGIGMSGIGRLWSCRGVGVEGIMGFRGYRIVEDAIMNNISEYGI
jgi:hypothetical protein